ncbi:MAG: hypothetical protein HLUCCO17_04030 [Saliniramus fredricksonii]|jgi:hypothetical protein|uniref:Uncharacterized protein n=1 Tax=Saliniramus fredricksonii TaxID=1653334 RepID=A0A0P7XWT8_9HYPH|nr:MAG: hypothetical protein HLUCCO17_04030 [Saliniramus fredricksonii]SCC81532.1 hypothetical protein GA0071312_2477 [Saliniramus fredricksonii]
MTCVSREFGIEMTGRGVKLRNIFLRSFLAMERQEIPEWLSWTLTLILIPAFLIFLATIYVITAVFLRYLAGFSPEDILSMVVFRPSA